MNCHRCDIQMKSGRALRQTFTAGTPDFPSDTCATTFLAGGSGRLVACLKCPGCGRSLAGQGKAV